MKNSAIEKRLVGNGHLIAEAKRANRSIHSSPDGKVISRVRDEAKAAGYTFSKISQLEWEGELGVRGVVAHPVESVFKGLQHFSWIRPFRLYDIKGDHPQNNSTVTVMTLVHEHIFISDINFFQVAVEYLNEASFMLFCAADCKFQSLKASVKNLFKGGK